jgi:hypothetical protein
MQFAESSYAEPCLLTRTTTTTRFRHALRSDHSESAPNSMDVWDLRLRKVARVGGSLGLRVELTWLTAVVERPAASTGYLVVIEHMPVRLK